MQRPLGVNTWVWVSPLTDASLADIARVSARIGYEVLELPIEAPGGWDPARAKEILAEHGLAARIVGAMGAGRDLLLAEHREATQAYLRRCVDVAVALSSPTVAGPFTAQTGRVWRMDSAQRAEAISQLRTALTPVAQYAADRGITLAIEPLNRYETSLLNTVSQTMEALGPLLGNGAGLALDTYHLNIEEQDPPGAIRAAGEHCHVVQVCGNDRGPVGPDHTDWPATFDALDAIGYAGPVTLESFTADNDTIATAASIWRPLAPSPDDLAQITFDYLTDLQQRRAQQ